MKFLKSRSASVSSTRGAISRTTRPLAASSRVTWTVIHILLQPDPITLIDGYTESQRIVASEIEDVQIQRFVDAVRRDIDEELARVRIGRRLDVGTDTSRRRYRHTRRWPELELDRPGFVIPMDTIQRIEMKPQIHRAVAASQDSEIPLRADLDVERLRRTLEHGLEYSGKI